MKRGKGHKKKERQKLKRKTSPCPGVCFERVATAQKQKVEEEREEVLGSESFKK